MKTELHQQKIQILCRLIKESSLTLEEALLLLQEEQVEKTPVITQPSTFPWTPSPYIGSGTPLSGTITTGTGTIMFSNTNSTMPIPLNNTTAFAQSVLAELKKETEDADL